MLLVAKNIISDSNLFFYLYNFSQSTTFEYNSFIIHQNLMPTMAGYIRIAQTISITFKRIKTNMGYTA